MRAPLSVIIPTLNAAHTLPACLAALMEGVEAGLIRELIISDGGSTDCTRDLAEAWGAEVMDGPASRGGQLRRGCAAAKAEWLLVVHADTVLTRGWSGAVQSGLKLDSAGWFRLQFDQRGLLSHMVAAWANLRSRCGLPYGDQGLLISQSLYALVGGYPDQPLMEDVAIVRALAGRLRGLDAVAVTSAAKYQQQGWLKRGGRNLWLLLRYVAGAAPEDLARAYRR